MGMRRLTQEDCPSQYTWELYWNKKSFGMMWAVWNRALYTTLKIVTSLEEPLEPIFFVYGE